MLGGVVCVYAWVICRDSAVFMWVGGMGCLLWARVDRVGALWLWGGAIGIGSWAVVADGEFGGDTHDVLYEV